ncbi:MAG: NAD(P)H-dependent oxidoreductase subunit E [Firmicutes bacterium]|nr:NAD(P)H-dependent oxidoreductase subunit E [Bacillota bacterium]
MRQTAEARTDPQTAHLYEKLGNVIDLYRGREGSLIQVLHLAQEIFGYLPLEVQEYVSREMDIPLTDVTGVVSFYSFFSEKPRGEHSIRVCLGTACYVRGGKKIVEFLRERLGCELGDTTEDGKFTFEVARCIGACGLAPAMMIDDTVYKQVNINKLEKILSEY